MDRARQGFYRALTARDRRFDGVFFVGVTSTRIYCRPICPARTPKAANCRFFASAQAAEREDFRPCLRCRPELAPGNAPIDDSQRIARLIVQRLEEGGIENDARLETIAGQFALSSRQIRRIIRKELGVAPVQLLQTRRLLLAKQLLTETRLPITRIAFASGFSSLRRFNDAFDKRYRMAPTRLRKDATAGVVIAPSAESSCLQLAYRPPYDWHGVLAFLRSRELLGVERVGESSYARTVTIGPHTGWIRVTHAPDRHVLHLEFAHGLLPALPAVIGRVRALFDLDAHPELIGDHLGRHASLAERVRNTPGLRVPGAFDSFELGLRAILGQQITVQAATTLAGRLVAAFGEPLAVSPEGLDKLTPSAARLAAASVDSIARLGVTRARAHSLIALAQAQTGGTLELDGGVGADPARAIARLCELPGIGPWTAHYIAMRALRWPDAFPPGDVVVRKRLGGSTAREIDAQSQAWRPWRSYALLHLWRNPVTSEPTHAKPSRKTAVRPLRDAARGSPARQR